jgi:hypothetical protein
MFNQDILLKFIQTQAQKNQPVNPQMQPQGQPPMQRGGSPIVTSRGQWDYPGQVTQIPSNRITMQGVNYPVLGVSDTGHTQLMHPEGEYKFNGNSVTEYPIAQQGGHTWLNQYPNVHPQLENGGQHGGLDRWFAEKWVDVKTGKPCGRQEGENRKGYPACRPSKRVSSETPKTASELSSSEKERFKREKTSSKKISYQHRRKEEGGNVNDIEMVEGIADILSQVDDMSNRKRIAKNMLSDFENEGVNYNYLNFLQESGIPELASGGNVPTNPSLWSKAKAAAKAKYDVYPSAYANGFAAKWYKQRGGGWRKAKYGMEVDMTASDGWLNKYVEAGATVESLAAYNTAKASNRKLKQGGLYKAQEGLTTSDVNLENTNDFLIQPSEYSLYDSKIKECKPGDAGCLEQAQLYYDKFIAPKLGTPDSWQIKENANLSSGPKNPRYNDYEESVDSWDIHAGLQEKGAKKILAAPLNDPYKIEKDLKKMSVEQQKEYFRNLNIPIGSIIGMGSQGVGVRYGKKSYNKKHGLVPSNHSAVVAGYDETGVPVLYDYGKMVSILDRTFIGDGFPITNITTPKETSQFTYKYLKDNNMLEDSFKSLKLLTKTDDYDEDEYVPFVNALSKNKQLYANVLGLSNNKYDEFARRAAAIALTESKGGDDGTIRWGMGLPVPSYLLDKTGIKFSFNLPIVNKNVAMGQTQGITQINSDMIFNDSKMSKKLKNLGITEATYDAWNPEHAAAITMALLQNNEKTQNINSKKNIKKLGYDPKLSDAALSYYQWNQPGLLVKGEAEGNSERVKKFLNNYNQIVVNPREDLIYKKEGGAIFKYKRGGANWLNKYQQAGVTKEKEKQVSSKSLVNSLMQAEQFKNSKSFASESTGVQTQAAAQKFNKDITEDIDIMSDMDFHDKYNTSKHKYKYDHDTKYRAITDQEIKKAQQEGRPMLKEQVMNNPNLTYFVPGMGYSPEESKAIIEGNLNVIGAVLPIPGLQSVGKFPSVFTGVESAAKSFAPVIGDYLATQTPLKNAWKLNPNAIKENTEMFLYRARPIGQTPEMNMAAQFREKEAAGKPLTWWEKNFLNEQTNPHILAREKYHGKWFDKDPSRLKYYMDGTLSNYSADDAVELLRVKLPKSEASGYNVSNFEDAKRISLAHQTEFILPKDVINSAETFPESSWKQLVQEDKTFNTPHWWKGFPEVPKQLPFKNIPKISSEQLKDMYGFLDRRQFIKQLQKEGLIGKGFKDLNYAARSTDKTNALTKLALNREATRYRGVEVKLPLKTKGVNREMGVQWDMTVPAWDNEISELENMKLAGVDLNDAISIAKYQASHVPMQQYGYRSGMPDLVNVDALYTGFEPTTYGNYQIKLTSPRDYSVGNYKDWFNRYYNPKNNLEKLAIVDDNGRSYWNRKFKPNASFENPIVLSETNRSSVVGKKGQKMFDVDESFPYMDVNNLTNAQKSEYNAFLRQLRNDHHNGWKGLYKQGGEWLDKYEKAGTTKSNILTYASNPEYFDNHAVYSDNPQYNDLIRKSVYAGTHGFDPQTGALYKLDKPVNVPKNVQKLASQKGPTTQAELFENNPELRKQYIIESTKKAFENPLMYAPGSIGLAALPETFGMAYGLGHAGAEALQGNYTQAGIEAGLSMLPFLPHTYKLNPYAERLNNANKSYRVAGLDALEDFQNTGVLRSVQQGVPEGASLTERAMSRPTGFPSFQKGYADMRYAPEEGAVVFETGLPTFKRGEINPVTGFPIKGRHYAHRVIDPETGKVVTQIPISDIKVFDSKPHWFKGFKEITDDVRLANKERTTAWTEGVIGNVENQIDDMIDFNNIALSNALTQGRNQSMFKLAEDLKVPKKMKFRDTKDLNKMIDANKKWNKKWKEFRNEYIAKRKNDPAFDLRDIGTEYQMSDEFKELYPNLKRYDYKDYAWPYNIEKELYDVRAADPNSIFYKVQSGLKEKNQVPNIVKEIKDIENKNNWYHKVSAKEFLMELRGILKLTPEEINMMPKFEAKKLAAETYKDMVKHTYNKYENMVNPQSLPASENKDFLFSLFPNKFGGLIKSKNGGTTWLDKYQEAGVVPLTNSGVFAGENMSGQFDINYYGNKTKHFESPNFNKEVYYDTRKIPTIGYGFNLNDANTRNMLKEYGYDYKKLINKKQKLDREDADRIFDKLFIQSNDIAKKKFENYNSLPMDAQYVVTDMIYNMGPNRIDSFKKFKKALNDTNFTEAANQLVDSDYYGQTKSRAESHVNTLRNMLNNDQALIRNTINQQVADQQNTSFAPMSTFVPGVNPFMNPVVDGSDKSPFYKMFKKKR